MDSRNEGKSGHRQIQGGIRARVASEKANEDLPPGDIGRGPARFLLRKHPQHEKPKPAERLLPIDYPKPLQADFDPKSSDPRGQPAAANFETDKPNKPAEKSGGFPVNSVEAKESTDYAPIELDQLHTVAVVSNGNRLVEAIG
jgi:hypothetical protein